MGPVVCEPLGIDIQKKKTKEYTKRKYAKICENMQKYAKICEIWRKKNGKKRKKENMSNALGILTQSGLKIACL
jgi:hypothetical protein